VPNSETRRGRIGIGVAQTLDTQCNQGVLKSDKIRRLTPLECFRLQDFPDSHVENSINAGVSDSQLYKQAGNSITVRVLEKILNKLNL
jgi:DNA (cytosine-5)-methyltransferase 1